MNFNKLKFGATIGIVGGDQLGKMMAQSAQKMGYKVVVLGPSEDCPCRYVAHEFIQAKYDDEKALNRLGQKCGVIAYEFENISTQQLKLLCEKYNIPQGYQAIQLLQDRLAGKETLKGVGTKVVPFISVKESTDIDKAIEALEYPFIVKTRFGGYDGKNQVLINNEKDLQGDFKLIETSECVAEKYLNIKKGVSLTVIRENNNQITSFPLQEDEYRNQILFRTIVPARIDKTAEAKEQVNKIIQSVHFIETLTVEFFTDSNNQLYANEIAPRPHSSGHYSIEAYDYSQFGTHILAVTGQSLPSLVELLKPAVMMNLLGKDLGLLESEFNEHSEWHLHIHGKSECKGSRKMGHVTVLTNDVNQTGQDMYVKFGGGN